MIVSLVQSVVLGLPSRRQAPARCRLPLRRGQGRGGFRGVALQPAVAVFSWCKVNNHFPITASRRRLFPAGAARRRQSPGGPAAVGALAACAPPALRPWGVGRFGLPYGPFGPAERAVSARRMARFATRCLLGPCAACPRPLPVAGRAPCRPRPFSHVV